MAKSYNQIQRTKKSPITIQWQIFQIIQQFAFNPFYFPSVSILPFYFPSSYYFYVNFMNPNQTQQKASIQSSILIQNNQPENKQIQHIQTNIQLLNSKSCKFNELQQKGRIKIKKNNSGESSLQQILLSQQLKNQKKRRQNQRRNVIPNLIHQILSYLSRQSKSGNKVKQLLNSIGNHRTTMKRYFLFLKSIKQQISRYINLKEFLKALKPLNLVKQNIISLSQQQIYCQIIRRIIAYYLTKQAVCITIHSQKIRRQNRLFHFEAQRKILQSLKKFDLQKNL